MSLLFMALPLLLLLAIKTLKTPLCGFVKEIARCGFIAKIGAFLRKLINFLGIIFSKY
jgi:hypothetical protein